MSEWGGPCTACGHPASYHGATFCQVRAGAAQKRDCDCTGYASPADAPILAPDDPGAAEWERCDTLDAELRALCDDYDVEPRPAFGAVPIWRLRRLLDRHGPAVVPMSPDMGHDLRERIAQRIDQAWAEANDRRPRSEYRDGYLDGLEHAEAAARSTPLTMGGAS